MSIIDFMNKFIISPVPVEVTFFNGTKELMTYVGGETNWDAFKKHLSGFTRTNVFSVSVKDDKLILKSSLLP